MIKINLANTVNLSEARACLARVLPHLPLPQIAEHMDGGGIALPKIGPVSTALPLLEQPTTLLARVGPLGERILPELWKPAYYMHKQRLRRNTQLVRVHALGAQANPADLQSVDGVVAGVLLMTLRPNPGPLRHALLERALAGHAWGAFFAAHGTIIADEPIRLLNEIGTDPRLAAAFYLGHRELGAPLVNVARGRSDVWSAVIVLPDVAGEQWLGRVVTQAVSSQIAAVTALTLQPSASDELKKAWIDLLRTGPPRFAYWAVRWTRFTWPLSQWLELRDRLRETAVKDRGAAWYHWHRDNEDPGLDAPFREEGVDVLWLAEWVHHTRNCGQELRRQMKVRLQTNSHDQEARLVLRWLKLRGRPHE